MIAIGALILLTYLFTLLWVLTGMYRLRRFRPGKSFPPRGFSIIIPFRDEESHLRGLCRSLLNLDYPKTAFEVLLIDDGSTDRSVAIIGECLSDSGLNWKILKNIRQSNSPKKDAITAGVQQSRYDWIVTTDADCQVPEKWLSVYSEFIQTNDPYLVCGPVRVDCRWEGGLQTLENLSLQGVTMGGFGWQRPLLCNGANLAFKKDRFSELGGYEDNNHVASGDDVFLLQKMNRFFAGKARFLKSDSATVTTKGVSGLKQIISQRTRWARKTARLRNWRLSLIGLIVFVTNLLLVLLLIHVIIEPRTLVPAVVAFFVKLAIDSIYIQEVNSFYRHRLPPLLLVGSGLLYPFLSVIIVLISSVSGYRWKGRYHRR